MNIFPTNILFFSVPFATVVALALIFKGGLNLGALYAWLSTVFFHVVLTLLATLIGVFLTGSSKTVTAYSLATRTPIILGAVLAIANRIAVNFYPMTSTYGLSMIVDFIIILVVSLIIGVLQKRSRLLPDTTRPQND